MHEKKGAVQWYLGVLLWHMLLCILGQLHHLRVWFLHIVAVGAVHQCGAHSKQHCLILRLQEHKLK